jgi:hypothetical protein
LLAVRSLRAAAAAHPEDADQAQDGDAGGVDHDRKQAEHDHEDVDDVPSAIDFSGKDRGQLRARRVRVVRGRTRFG